MTRLSWKRAFSSSLISANNAAILVKTCTFVTIDDDLALTESESLSLVKLSPGDIEGELFDHWGVSDDLPIMHLGGDPHL